MARLGGLIVMLVGAALALAAGSLGLALLGRPVPDLPGIVQLKPWLTEIAAAVALPAGAAIGALSGVTVGRLALGGVAAGLLVMLGGLVQVLWGKRNAGTIGLVLLGILGFAAVAALA